MIMCIDRQFSYRLMVSLAIRILLSTITVSGLCPTSNHEALPDMRTQNTTSLEMDVSYVSSRAAFYHIVLKHPDQLTQVIGRTSEVSEGTSYLRRPKRQITDNGLFSTEKGESTEPVSSSMTQSCFPRPFSCDVSVKYRTITGWCNNLRRPSIGVPRTPFRRLAPSAYDDGKNEPRQRSRSGGPLPSPRTVSSIIHSSLLRAHPRYTLLLMQWGQFIDHDMTLTPMETAGDGAPLDCNDCDSRQTVNNNCWPIPIPDNDPAFGPASIPGKLCLPFIRSQAAQSRSGARDQINQFTSYIDLSHIYGSDECTLSQLRGNARNGGRMAVQTTSVGETLPIPDMNGLGCRSDKERPCMMAGDSRINEHMGVTGLHAVLLREHNTIADKLAAINPTWTDERLFQEARRILIAIYQHITYNEFLPLFIGAQTMSDFDLVPLPTGFYQGHDPECESSISNEFSTAAFRCGHSLVPSTFPITDQKYRKLGSFNLTELFFNPGRMYNPNFCDQFMMGMISEPMQNNDRFASPIVHDQLFAFPDDPKSGFDLFAINIHRGRDHGLPSYTHYRDIFQLTVPTDFTHLRNWMDEGAVTALSSVYESVHDIDLFTGLLSERPLPGAVVGPTAAKILGEQFHRSRKCDRFWYENPNQSGSFTSGQLEIIRKESLARLLCRNLPMIETIQPRLFELPDSTRNARAPCSSFLPMDLSLWAE